MSLSTRALEEDEAKIDNLLHKVLSSSRLIRELNNQIDSIKDKNYLDKEYVIERTKKIDILINTIINLVILADDIDVTDEQVTENIEKELKDKLAGAISDIKEISDFLDSTKQ